MISLRTLEWYFTVKSLSDFLRILRFPFLIGLQLGKAYYVFWNCGCTVSDLHNWITQSQFTPYYWRNLSSGVQFVAGPYSVLWYFLNSPARFGYWNWMSYLFIADTIISLTQFWSRSWRWLPIYSFISLYFIWIDPIDLWIFWFALLGQKTLLGVGLSIATKLPIGAPFYVWNFILNNPLGINEEGGYFRYSLLIFLWTMGIVFYLQRLRYSRKVNGVGSVRTIQPDKDLRSTHDFGNV